MKAEHNELLVRTSPGTPMGELFRRFWLPALLSEELPRPDSPPVRVRLLGEDLVAFRDSGGRIGLLAPLCSHRGAPLFYGRNEEHGIRCVYHGWKYDVAGRCVDMPSEPADSTFKERIQHKAYPCRERGGVIWFPAGGRVWVPIDDEHTWTYFYSFHPGRPLTDDERARIGNGHSFPPQLLPGTYSPLRNRANEYLIDRELQRTTTYTGIFGVNDQDRAIQEGMGAVFDRSQ